jgi:hypothetical protein
VSGPSGSVLAGGADDVAGGAAAGAGLVVDPQPARPAATSTASTASVPVATTRPDTALPGLARFRVPAGIRTGAAVRSGAERCGAVIPRR